MDHGYPDDGFTGFWGQLITFTQASVAIALPEGAFHDPALRRYYNGKIWDRYVQRQVSEKGSAKR
jgi:hypothetical protein